MAFRKIIYLPDPRLRKRSADIKPSDIDDALQLLIDDMFVTMRKANGVGLAAPQIGINVRLAVIDATPQRSESLVLINPEIIARKGRERFQEGCLSVPGAFDTVERAAEVTMRALDRHGKVYEVTADGLLGECIQHEIDHLDGTLFIDLLSPLKRERARRKLEKFKRRHRED